MRALEKRMTTAAVLLADGAMPAFGRLPGVVEQAHFINTTPACEFALESGRLGGVAIKTKRVGCHHSPAFFAAEALTAYCV